MESVVSAVSGAVFGLSLIVAIGPQNAFVLRKGLSQEHTGHVVAICVVSDALLIAAGATGVGATLDARPWLTDVIRFGGAAFLGAYASMALIRAARQQQVVAIGIPNSSSLTASVSTCLAFTWLNPHVYLDTVILLGAIANSPGRSPIWFAIGAMTASAFWFTGLGYGARYLRPLFTRPMLSRGLDLSIAVVMLCIGISLLVEGIDV